MKINYKMLSDIMGIPEEQLRAEVDELKVDLDEMYSEVGKEFTQAMENISSPFADMWENATPASNTAPEKTEPEDEYRPHPFSYQKSQSQPSNVWKPEYEVQKEDDAVVIKVEVPGFRKEDLSVDVDNEILSVSGARVKNFVLDFKIGSLDDINAIQSSYDSGLLTILIVKAVKQPEDNMFSVTIN